MLDKYFHKDVPSLIGIGLMLLDGAPKRYHWWGADRTGSNGWSRRLKTWRWRADGAGKNKN